MSSQGDALDCGRWEAAVADLLDGTLPPDGEGALRKHAAGCRSCGPLLEGSERGRSWARLLHDAPPEPPLDLFAKILARTDALPVPPGHELESPADGALVLGHPAFLPGGGFPAARWLMTGAMALFSLALTASLSGVHPGQLRATAHSTLHGGGPESVQGVASRQFFDTKKQVVSFYDNLRLVREVESRVDALRHAPGGGGRESGDSSGPSARLGGELPALARNALPRNLLGSLPQHWLQALPRDPATGERNRL